MKYLMVLSCLTFSSFTFAQSKIGMPEEMKELVEVAKMTEVAAKISAPEDAKPLLLNIDYSLPDDCPPEEKALKESARQRFTLMEKPDPSKYKWSVSIRTSLSGPKGKLKKESLGPNDVIINNKLDKIITGDFASYDERLNAIKQECNGLDDIQKIRLSGALAGRLSNIYDYGRANGGSSAIIGPEQQWQALKSGVASGVCRDASITVSQFLLACGFRKEQLAIKSYRTQGGGHQVNSINTPEGEYNINWGEIYNYKGVDNITNPNPSIPNSGMMYTLYDPETGAILEQRRTELGDAIKIITGGTSKDPTFTTDQIVAEAAFGGFAAKVFEINTRDGDRAKGGAVVFKQSSQSEREYTDLSIGAKNYFKKHY